MKTQRPPTGGWAENALHETTLGVVLLLWIGGVPINVALWYVLIWLFPQVSFWGVVGIIWVLMFNAAWLVYSIARTVDLVDP
jgi:hypothetical protein